MGWSANQLANGAQKPLAGLSNELRAVIARLRSGELEPGMPSGKRVRQSLIQIISGGRKAKRADLKGEEERWRKAINGSEPISDVTLMEMLSCIADWFPLAVNPSSEPRLARLLTTGDVEPPAAPHGFSEVMRDFSGALGRWLLLHRASDGDSFRCWELEILGPPIPGSWPAGQFRMATVLETDDGSSKQPRLERSDLVGAVLPAETHIHLLGQTALGHAFSLTFRPDNGGVSSRSFRRAYGLFTRVITADLSIRSTRCLIARREDDRGQHMGLFDRASAAELPASFSVRDLDRLDGGTTDRPGSLAAAVPVWPQE